jgi:N-acetylmuramoyl-L-alanine amidase
MFDAKTRNRKETKYIAVHCSATQAKQDVGAVDIDRWHRARGFTCIGYNYVIRRDGDLEIGRPELQIGAHVEGFNSVSLGVCMVGGINAQGKPENNFTEAQFKTLEKLLRDLRKRYPTAIIQGHRDFPKVNKACPSFSVTDWVKEKGI